MSLTLLLVSLLLSSAQGQFSCGEGSLLPDERDCTRFLKCHAGVPTSLACPAGLRSVLLFDVNIINNIIIWRFNPQISACDWPDAVDCRGEREANTLISGARMVWQREPSPASPTTENILELQPSLDKLTQLISFSHQETRANSQIKESLKKTPNVAADVLARVKGKLLPGFLREGGSTRLAKQVPAKAVLVETFRPEAAPGLRLKVLEGERNKYPRAASIV